MTKIECVTYGIIKDEKTGSFLLRDMLFRREGVLYSISVGVPDYIHYVRERNLTLPNNSRSDENIFPLGNLNNPELVCQTLHSLPIDELRPYLSPQKDDSSTNQ